MDFKEMNSKSGDALVAIIAEGPTNDDFAVAVDVVDYRVNRNLASGKFVTNTLTLAVGLLVEQGITVIAPAAELAPVVKAKPVKAAAKGKAKKARDPIKAAAAAYATAEVPDAAGSREWWTAYRAKTAELRAV